MTLTDGRWNFSVTKPDGFICDDGSYQPAVISISVDPATLAGGWFPPTRMAPARAAF